VEDGKPAGRWRAWPHPHASSCEIGSGTEGPRSWPIMEAVAELTRTDLREMKHFLSGTCAEVKRWLPEPEWRPGWQSEAANERANQEAGPNGPWGADPVRAVYTAAALYLEMVLQSLRALRASLSTDSTPYVPYCLARAAMEAGSQALWLLEPGIGARRRVARFMLIRASGAQHRAEEAAKTGIADPNAETPERAAALAASLGLECEYRKHKGRYGGAWWCEGEKLPGYTERNKMLEGAMFTSGVYSIYSAAVHAEWHAVAGNWQEAIQADGSKAIITRPDRVAVWGAVLIAAAPAVAPATRAFQLLDYRARRTEIVYGIDNTLALMRRTGLPREWWWIDQVH
jgi:hypothetical protein